MTRRKTFLAFNPDTMTVSDVKAAAGSLRNLLDRFEMLNTVHGDNERAIADDLYGQILQLDTAYTTREDDTT